MKANHNTVLVGEKIILVPYRPEHVPRYHEWMCDEELRQLTASEPLTLEEEYAMQETWLIDNDKLTFIILARDPNSAGGLTSSPPLSPSDSRVTALPMIGDVNIFLKGAIPSLPDALAYRRPSTPTSTDGDDAAEDEFEVEVEIMIAEPVYRRKGLALETLQLMLTYATGAPISYFANGQSTRDYLQSPIKSPLNIPPASLVTRISQSNIPSIQLFEKLGFKITKRVEVFGEVEMRWFASRSG